jgi:hypothetical protein
MEKFEGAVAPKETPDKSPENYESLLEVTFANASLRDLKNEGTFTFAVTEAFTIFITRGFHASLVDNYGVDLDRTLTEGYITSVPGMPPRVEFKHAIYQSTPGFKGTPQELSLLQAGVKNKINNLAASAE